MSQIHIFQSATDMLEVILGKPQYDEHMQAYRWEQRLKMYGVNTKKLDKFN